MKTVRNALIKLGTASTLAAVSMQGVVYGAACNDTDGLGGLSGGAQCADPGTGAGNLTGVFGDIANVLIFLVGAIAVIMLIVGGLRYVISGGDPKNVEGAKNVVIAIPNAFEAGQATEQCRTPSCWSPECLQRSAHRTRSTARSYTTQAASRLLKLKIDIHCVSPLSVPKNAMCCDHCTQG